MSSLDAKLGDGLGCRPLQTHVDFECLLAAALAQECDVTDSEISSNESSPLASPRTSPTASPSHVNIDLPAALDNPFDANPLPASHLSPQGAGISRENEQRTLSNREAYKRKRSKIRKARKRATEAKLSRTSRKFADIELRASIEKRFVKNAVPVPVDYDVSELPAAATGFVGLSCKGYKKELKLEDLGSNPQTQNFKLVRWNNSPQPYTDDNSRVMAVHVPPPQDVTFMGAVGDAAVLIDEARDSATFTQSEKDHRRGKFTALASGISYGQGQPHPMNLSHRDKSKAAIFEKLFKHEAFIRIAGFQSASFLAWAPKLHRHYAETMDALLAHDPTLKQNFDTSVFACATVNFGPRTICYRHRDTKNLPYGWCAITALGNYDYTKGGHLILWELELVIEFPPGSTIFLPSACISHSNVSVGKDEKRFSFTQYTAGSIFCWIEHGFMNEESFWASLSEKERAEESERSESRLKRGISLLRTLK